MLRHGTGPIATSHSPTGLLILVQTSSHQLCTIRPHVHFKVSSIEQPSLHCFRNFICNGHEPAFATGCPIGDPTGIGQKRSDAKNGITSKEGEVNTFVPGFADIIVHFQTPVLVVPHRDKPIGSKQPLRVGVGIDIGNIGHIVSFLLHPKSQGEFPRQVFPTATRLLHFVYWMGKKTIRTIEADRSAWYTNTRPILMLRVNRIVHGPSVVGRPGEITALKKKITRTVVSNNKNNIALDSASFSGHLSKVYATWPSLGDFQFHGWFPLALTNIVFTDGRIRLCPGL